MRRCVDMRLEKGNLVRITDDAVKIDRLKAEGFEPIEDAEDVKVPEDKENAASKEDKEEKGAKAVKTNKK